MNKKILALFLLSLIFYLAVSFTLMHRPLVGDDTLNAVAFHTPKVGYLNIWGHPPFCYDLIRTLVHFLGIRGENLRIFGILCFLISVYLINLISREVTPDRNVGLLASILYAINPLIVQGSQVLDIDNTILTVVLLMTILYFLNVYKKLKLKNILFLGLLFFLGLWSKLSTPFILLICIFVFYILRGEIKAGIIRLSIITALGISLFLILWLAYSKVYGVDYFLIFRRSLYVLSKTSGGPTFAGFRELGLRFSRVYLWLGPYLTILWGLVVILRIKDYFSGQRRIDSRDFLIIYTLLVFFSYIIIGGSSMSFVKYHYPAVSIMCIVIAEFALKLKWSRIKKSHLIYLLVLGLVFIILEQIYIRDLLYQLNYNLRKIAVFTPEKVNNFILDFVKRLSVYHLPFIMGLVLFYLAGRKKEIIKNLALLLMVLILISNLSLNIRQVRADYFTTLCYGRSIKEFRLLVDLFKKIHMQNPDGIIIGPEDVLTYAIGHWYPGYTYDIFFNNREKFLGAIKEERVCCVVYGFSWNAVHTFKEVFFHPSVKNILERDYKLYPLGEYSVWVRKN